MTEYRKIILNTLQKVDVITTAQAYDLCRKKEKEVPKSTVGRRLHTMEKEGLIERVGHGCYRLRRNKLFDHTITQEMKRIGKILNDAFPLVSWCVWTSDILQSLTRHIPAERFILLDVEYDSREAVHLKLLEVLKNVYLSEVYEKVKGTIPENKPPVIIRNFVSQVPVVKKESIRVPTLEKMLVDFALDDVFNFLQGAEIATVYETAFSRYAINQNRMLRYADRRTSRDRIEKLITNAK